MPAYSGVWSLSQQFQARGQGLWPAPPGAPTIGTATATGVGTASVTFTAPTCTGIPAGITGYIAKSTPGCITVTGSSSPIAFSGLCSSTAYTFAVAAQNASGYGAYSAQSNSVTPNVVVGQTQYTTPGTYSWVAPAGVTSVSVVAVGSSGNTSTGGGGGHLSYGNNISVTPGTAYTVYIGSVASSGQSAWSYFNSTGVLYAGRVGCGGGSARTGGGNGGSGYGGGAGGYSGSGGAGGQYSGSSGSGGGGGGGSGWYCGSCCGIDVRRGGGGVGLLGQGASGSGQGFNQPGSGGSGGTAGTGAGGVSGGLYGGGNGYEYVGTVGFTAIGNVSNGAVRIIWPGNTRSFPSTNTGNL